MQWFGVALWSRWPPLTSVCFPEQMGMVEARSAFAAIIDRVKSLRGT